jgi:hypothetical protein
MIIWTSIVKYNTSDIIKKYSINIDYYAFVTYILVQAQVLNV